MTPRERFLAALDLKQPDRVPMFDFLFQQPLYEALIGRRPENYNGRDAIACANALLKAGAGRWVVGDHRETILSGDLLLFRFDDSWLRQPAGVYAAGWVGGPPSQDDRGVWVVPFTMDPLLTRRLIREPITGTMLAQILPRYTQPPIHHVPTQPPPRARRRGQAAQAQ